MVTGGEMVRTPVRITPIPEEQWTEETRDVFAIYEGEDGRKNGSKFNVIRMMANHPTLAKGWLTYNRQLLRAPTIPDRLREIAVLRVAWHHRSEYEWVQHVMLGKRHGLDDEDIDAIKRRAGADEPRWSELECATLHAVDQLLDRSEIDQDTWNALASHLGQSELIELMFVIGTYSMLSLVFNAVGLELEPDAGIDRKRTAG